MADESTALSLLAGIEFDDTRLYSLLEIVIRDFYKLDRQINPPTSQGTGASGIQLAIIGSVSNFTSIIFTNNVRLSWSSLTGASSYEIRYKSGVQVASDWDTASSILKTSSLSADINPITIPLIYGNHTFFIKAIDSSGIYSTTATILTINIPTIPSPIITPTVIDNNVLLKWTIPISLFQINYYNVYRNNVLQGIMNGTFEVIFETASGSYEYKVEAVDIVGNVSNSTSVTQAVRQPPDFELKDSRISQLNGTLVNVIKEGLNLVCSLNLTETFEEHFTSRGWNNVQDQINAGFPLHCQPTLTSGSYEESIDYGVLLSNVIITINWSELELSPTVSVSSELATST